MGQLRKRGNVWWVKGSSIEACLLPARCRCLYMEFSSGCRRARAKIVFRDYNPRSK